MTKQYWFKVQVSRVFKCGRKSCKYLFFSSFLLVKTCDEGHVAGTCTGFNCKISHYCICICIYIAYVYVYVCIYIYYIYLLYIYIIYIYIYIYKKHIRKSVLFVCIYENLI